MPDSRLLSISCSPLFPRSYNHHVPESCHIFLILSKSSPSELVISLAIASAMPLGTSGVFRNLCLRDALEDRLWIAA